MKIKAKSIAAFIAYDGQLFTDRRKADAHQENLLGEMLDGLLPHDDRGNVTQVDRFNILLKMMQDEDLYKKIAKIYNLLREVKDEESQ